MKKLLTLFAGTLITGSLLAGGLVTNNNQSVLFTRMQNRNSSTAIDAVYYNPAGLARLGNGLFVSLNGQYISQTRTITSDYLFLNGVTTSAPRTYQGETKVPVYPGIYAAFKIGKLAVSAGFNPIGGGGGATFKEGLPSLEMQISELKPILTGMGLTTTQYSVDLNFKGEKVNYGYQANFSYALNDMISAAVGVRLVTAKNKYTGHLSNIMINPVHPVANPTGAMVSAPAFFTSINQPLYAAMTADREVDVEETGTGFTPILSLHVTPIENLNIALRYEFKTKLEVTAKVIDGKDAGIFIDGEKTIADMPATLAAGIDYKILDRLMLAYTFNMYFDKNVDYDGSASTDINMIDKNFLEYGVGAELGITEKLRVSAGWLATATGVNENYQSDQVYSANTNSFGGGFGFRITPMIDLNVGGQYTFYDTAEKTYERVLGTTRTVHETYDKSTWAVGVGLDLYFGK